MKEKREKEKTILAACEKAARLIFGYRSERKDYLTFF